MRLLLRGLRVADAGLDRRGDLRLAGGRIEEIGRGLAPRRREQVLELAGHLALPGLINAHDHLDLDLLPALGEPPYTSFYDWAGDVYRPGEPPIRDVLRVPARWRFAWGAHRNLISGVTTVVHHGSLPRRPLLGLPVRILRRYGWSHSLGFSGHVRRDHRRARGRPFIIHAAEGTDERAAKEIGQLDDLGVLAPGTVLVHAMACHEKIERLAATGTAVVWCPSSNLRLYGATAPVDRLLGQDRNVAIALGTDSTLSGEATLLDELRTAAGTGLAGPDELLAMVTSRAAAIFGLEDRGRLAAGVKADLVVLPDTGTSPAEQLLAAGPRDLRLVLIDGKPRLADEHLAGTLALGPPNALVDGGRAWLRGHLGRLKHGIRRAGGDGATRGVLWRRLCSPEP